MTNADRRLDAPSYHRNIGPITEVLKTILPNSAEHVLEVGSGSGQHVTAFAKAFPDITWWPTEYDPDNIASINAWRDSEGVTNVQPGIQLDAAQADWALGTDGTPPAALDAVFSANVIHISPWEVCAGIVRGAGHNVRTGGSLIFYGPFFRTDVATVASNHAFDQDLRARNPQWGIRNLDDVGQRASEAGFAPPKITEMPANNLIVRFVKQ